MRRDKRFQDPLADMIARTTADYGVETYGGHLPPEAQVLLRDMLFDFCLVSIHAYVTLPPKRPGHSDPFSKN